MFRTFGKEVHDTEMLNSGSKIGPAGVITLFTQGPEKWIAHM
jgi:hypothetical protein